jgi:hypothetical protein
MDQEGALMKRVFISYSRTNLPIVRQLVQDLKAIGVEAWYDETLTGGQKWWLNILANIRECDIFVFALSPDSWDSEACKSELSYVSQLGKTILPVLVADGINLNLLPAPLHEIQVTDYRRCDKEAAFALVRSINAAATSSPLPDPLPNPPEVPVSYLSTLKERIETSKTLTAQEQITLVFELETSLKDGRSQNEVRDLLLRLRRRDDLLAKVASNVDAALKGLDTNAPPASHENGGSAAAAARMATEQGRPVEAATSESRYCQQCGTQAPAASKFCASCGAGLQPSGAVKPAPLPMTPATPKASKSRRFLCASGNSTSVIADVKGWLEQQDFDSQQMATEHGGTLLQIKKRGAWRDFVGMSTSLNIVFHQSADTLTVEIGAGKWIDKAAAGTVSLFILWPLAVTAGFGAWEQMKMPDKVFEYIGSRLACK